MNRAKAIFLLAALAAIAANAATVSVGTYVCNPGATVRVPVSFESTGGLTGVSVTLSYDPQVVVCSRVEAGGLSAVFGDDFTGSAEQVGTATATLFSLGGNVAENIAGTAATFVFIARNGTAGEFSDITVTKVELLEESGVRDATVNNPVSTRNGMIRVMAADATAARMEEAQTVVADSHLGSLTLSEGDGIQASDAGTPIVIAGAVSAHGLIPLTAPDHGWATATYEILRTTTAGLSFANATNGAERLNVTETRSDGISTYSLAMEVEGCLAMTSSEPLSAELQSYVQSCVGRPDGVSSINVNGGAETIALAKAFGILPRVSVVSGVAEATFATPTVWITAFDLAGGTLTAVVRPEGENTIAGDGVVRGVIQVLGGNAPKAISVPVETVKIDLSGYFDVETAGQFRCNANFGGNRFFRVRIAEK